MCQASTHGRVSARARDQVLKNSASQMVLQWTCIMVVLRFTTLSARDRHWRNPRKKNYRERSNIKSARVSALTGSVPRNMAEAHRFPHWSRTKQMYDSSYFATCNWFFGVQDCSTRIFHLEYQGQTLNTRILERKPLIDTSYRIRHRLELKYFHFAQFLLNAHQAAHQPWKSENW